MFAMARVSMVSESDSQSIALTVSDSESISITKPKSLSEPYAPAPAGARTSGDHRLSCGLALCGPWW
jgi:hypothetical protein